MFKKNIENPYSLAFLTVVFWSFSSLLAKLISLQSPYLLFCFSFMFALPVYLLVAYSIYKKRLLKAFKKLPWYYPVIGLAGYYAVWVGNTESFQAYNSASETTVLNYTWLIFTVFFTETVFRYNKQLTFKRIIEFLGVLFGFLSVYVIAVKGKWLSFEFDNLEGILWGLFGGMTYGFFSAFSGTLSKNRQMLFLIAAICSGWVAMLITSIFTDGSVVEQVKSLSLRQLMYAALLGILVDALGYIMWTRSLSQARKLKLNVSKVVTIVFALPLTSLIIISLILKEDALLEPWFLLSLFLLFTGFLLTQQSAVVSHWLKKLKQ